MLHCGQEIFRIINQLKLLTTTSVTEGQCGNVVQNHILSVQVQATVQFLVQKFNILKQNQNTKNRSSFL